MATTVTSLDKYREAKVAQKPVVFSLEEAFGYIRDEPSTSVEKLAYLYDSTAIHVREDLLGKIANANDTEFPPYRKSMFFQVAHYVDHSEAKDELSAEMILAIYYGSMNTQRVMEIDRLGTTFLTKGIVSLEGLTEKVTSEFSHYPYRFSGNKRTAIVTALKTQFLTRKQERMS